MDMDLPLPIQEKGHWLVDPPLSIQEEGTFIEVKRRVARRPQEDAEPSGPRAEVKTAMLDSGVDQEGKKKRKRKKLRTRKEKKTIQKPLKPKEKISSVRTPYISRTRPIIALYLISQLITGALSDLCTATTNVSAHPISLNLDLDSRTLDRSVRCPYRERHFGIETCFLNDSSVKVFYEKGRVGALFIESGAGMSRGTRIDMRTGECTLSVEDETAAPTPEPREPAKDTAETGNPSSMKDRSEIKGRDVKGLIAPGDKDVRAKKSLAGIGVLCVLIFFLLLAVLWLFSNNRVRGQQLSAILTA